MTANWESWRYLHGLELLHDYKPQTEVTFLSSGAARTGKFKEWRGIVSSILSNMGKSTRCSIVFDGAKDVLMFEAYDDANPQIIIETLDDYLGHPLLACLKNYRIVN